MNPLEICCCNVFSYMLACYTPTICVTPELLFVWHRRQRGSLMCESDSGNRVMLYFQYVSLAMVHGLDFALSAPCTGSSVSLMHVLPTSVRAPSVWHAIPPLADTTKRLWLRDQMCNCTSNIRNPVVVTSCQGWSQLALLAQTVVRDALGTWAASTATPAELETLRGADLMIHFRCGDLLSHPHNLPPGYGFLPFAVLSDNLEPPRPREGRRHAHIGIVTNPTSCARSPQLLHNGGTARSNDCGGHTKCTTLLAALKRDLEAWAPSSRVSIYDEDTPLVSTVRLALANVSFCGPSTFCLWGTIAARNAVLFPWKGVPGIAQVAKIGHNRSQSLTLAESECQVLPPAYVDTWSAAQLSNGPLSKERALLTFCGLPPRYLSGARDARAMCLRSSNASCAAVASAHCSSGAPSSSGPARTGRERDRSKPPRDVGPRKDWTSTLRGRKQSR